MKQENMAKVYESIQALKYAMSDRGNVINDEEVIKELVEKNITDIKEKDVDKMVKTIIYLIENDRYFVQEIENEILRRVKQSLTVICDKNVKFYILLNFLKTLNIIDSDIAYSPELEKNLNQNDEKMYSYITIPISERNYLVISFDVLVKSLPIVNSEIAITDVYIA
jgi:hypothetical protein